MSYKGKKRWIYNSGSKIEGFSKGGWVEGLHEIARKQGDDIVTVNTLKRGEAVLSQPHAEIFKNFTDKGLYVIHDTMKTATDLARIAQKPAMSSETFSSQFSGDINISFQIDHVDDYNDLMDKIKNDHKFEKFIQSMTVDRLVGKGALEKHSIKWR